MSENRHTRIKNWRKFQHFKNRRPPSSFWPAIHTLVDLGLVERVGMLLDGDDDESEIIHPYAIRGGEPAEHELAATAQMAARAMVTEGQLNWSVEQDYHLVPVRKHIAKATVVEVFRLKYRPHTTATAAWFAQMHQTTAEYLEYHRAMIKDSVGSADEVGCNIKDRSRIDQG
jgi:hypothetical protein